MSRISILDCTLRDGGYVNNWYFGKETMRNIAKKLQCAKVELVECGFLLDNITDENCTLFSSFEAFKKNFDDYIDIKNTVLMIKTGTFDIKNLPACSNSTPNFLRIIFKKNQLKDALNFAKELLDKGYNVFLNPTFLSLYSEQEFCELAGKIKEINPYGFSFVDSIGSLNPKVLNNYYNIADEILSDKTVFCLHLHNSMQLAFKNARAFIDNSRDRKIIIDSSLYGMGRAAGNLRTEVICEYLNKTFSKEYKLDEIYKLLDEYMYDLYETYRWGFSLKYYLCAKLGIHTDYGSFLRKNPDIKLSRATQILSMIPDEKRGIFDKKLIDNIIKSFKI